MRLPLALFILSISTLCYAGAGKLCVDVLNGTSTPSIAQAQLTTKIGAPIGQLIQTEGAISSKSQESLFVKDARGQVYYLKKSLTHPELQTGAEVISAWIYRHFNYYTPETYIVNYKCERYSASTQLPKGTDSILIKDMPNTSHMRALKVVAKFLNDTDRLSIGPNNRILNDGSIALYDFGGTLGSTPIGEPKPGESVSEALGSFPILELHLNFQGEIIGDHPLKSIFDTFDITNLHPNHPWQSLNHKDVKSVLKLFRTLDSEKIKSIVARAKYTESKDENYMIRSLTKRRDIYLDYLENYLFPQTLSFIEM